MKYIFIAAISFIEILVFSKEALPQTFTKITTGDIVTDGGTSQAVAWGDYDNDGDQDLFVTNHNNEHNFLYRNNGDGTFTKVTTGAIVSDGGNSLSASWADYNNDGYLDLFVINQGQDNFLYTNNGDGTFTKITNSPVLTSGDYGCAWGDYDGDGYVDLFVTNSGGANNALFHNNTDGTFTEINTGDFVNDGGDSRGVSWVDLERDHDLDLFIANYGEANFVYINDGAGNLTKEIGTDRVTDVENSMGGSLGYSNGYYPILLVSNKLQETSAYNRFGGGFNVLGMGGDITSSVGSAWGDYDNDGFIDLYISNDQNENNLLYHNNGNGTFTSDIASNLVLDAASTAGCAWVDYDNDGDLDLFVANMEGDNFLFRNEGLGNNYLKVKIRGLNKYPFGIGATVTVFATINGTYISQANHIFSQSGLFGQNAMDLVFGLGDATIVDYLEIVWLDGKFRNFVDVSINQEITITEFAPDLKVYNEGINFSNIKAGDFVRVRCSIGNTDNESVTDASSLDYYFSKDMVLDGGDVLLGNYPFGELQAPEFLHGITVLTLKFRLMQRLDRITYYYL